MDCKRPHKYRALKQLLLVVCTLAMVSCSWIKDDTDDCPNGFWLQLHYTYNILDVEAVTRYVQDAYVFIYDAEGNYVKQIYATPEQLNANHHRVRVEGLPEGDYQFVVWSGIGNNKYAISGDTRTIDDFRLSLSGNKTECADNLPDLYHGALVNVHYDDSYAIHDVEMMKNTNQLACLIVSVDENAWINPDEYTLKVVSANGTMNAFNQLTSDVETTYKPFEQGEVTFEDADYGELQGIVFNLKTLRLMSDQDSRIILEKNSGSSDQVLFNISLPEYIGMMGTLYTNLGREIGVQEYLDRQDFYTVVFYLSSDLDQLLQLSVNNWRIRANHHLKL